MAKRLISCLLAFSLVFVFCACGGASAPDPKDYTPSDIINALADAGCSVGEITVYDENTDPNGNLGRPNQYTGKADFAIPGIDTINSATVESFATKADCQTRYDYLNQFTSAQFGALGLNQYMYKSDYAILRIPFEVTPTDAAAYEAAFCSFVGAATSAKPANNAPASEPEPSAAPAATGSDTCSALGYTVKIVAAHKTYGSDGDLQVAVEVEFTNDNADPIDFMGAAQITVFQNGVQQEKSEMYLGDGYDWDSYYRQIKDGATITVFEAFPLSSETDPVEVNVEIIDYNKWETAASATAVIDLT